MSRKSVAFSGFLQAFFSPLSNLRKFAQKAYFSRGFFRDFCKMRKTQARFRRNGPDNQTGSFPFWEKTNPMRMAAMAAQVIQFTSSWRIRAESMTETTGIK